MFVLRKVTATLLEISNIVSIKKVFPDLNLTLFVFILMHPSQECNILGISKFERFFKWKLINIYGGKKLK